MIAREGWILEFKNELCEVIDIDYFETDEYLIRIISDKREFRVGGSELRPPDPIKYPETSL